MNPILLQLVPACVALLHRRNQPHHRRTIAAIAPVSVSGADGNACGESAGQHRDVAVERFTHLAGTLEELRADCDTVLRQEGSWNERWKRQLVVNNIDSVTYFARPTIKSEALGSKV
jgi:hypothetical protein